MGGHGGLNILPQKKWNVYNYDNRDIVQKDKKQHAKKKQQQYKQDRKNNIKDKFDVLKGQLSSIDIKQDKIKQSFKKDSILNNEFKRLNQQKQHINLFEKQQKILQNKQLLQIKRLQQSQWLKDKSLDYSSKFLGTYNQKSKLPWYTKQKYSHNTKYNNNNYYNKQDDNFNNNDRINNNKGDKYKSDNKNDKYNDKSDKYNNKRKRYDIDDLVDDIIQQKSKHNHKDKYQLFKANIYTQINKQREQLKQKEQNNNKDINNNIVKRQQISQQRQRSRDRKYQFLKNNNNNINQSQRKQSILHNHDKLKQQINYNQIKLAVISEQLNQRHIKHQQRQRQIQTHNNINTDQNSQIHKSSSKLNNQFNIPHQQSKKYMTKQQQQQLEKLRIKRLKRQQKQYKKTQQLKKKILLQSFINN